MEYLIKSTLIISSFFVFYKLLLERCTFFVHNRVYFLMGMMCAVLLPVNQLVIELGHPDLINVIQNESRLYMDEFVEISYESSPIQYSWSTILKVIYFGGIFVLGVRFVINLLSILKLIWDNPKSNHGSFTFVHSKNDIAPSSFFNWIFIHSSKSLTKAYQPIIAHEKVHVAQFHTLDILVSEVFLIFHWFNPLAWIYKKKLEMNLEFIADKQASSYSSSVKEYQYLLLTIFQGAGSSSLVNHFFSSTIKNRIVMLKKSSTSRIQLLKFLFLIPVIGWFFAFQQSDGLQAAPIGSFFSQENQANQNEPLNLVSPVAKTDSYKIVSKFGIRRHPIYKISKMHSGIDIVSGDDVPILAGAEGKVAKAAYDSRMGNYIKIVHANGYQTSYLHLKKIIVKDGQIVKAGEQIGIIGATGSVSSAHLHFEVIKDGKHVDPMGYLENR